MRASRLWDARRTIAFPSGDRARPRPAR